MRSRGRLGWNVPGTVWAALAAAGVAGAYVLYSCYDVVPETGRARFLFVGRSMELKLGQTTYKNVKKQHADRILPPSHSYHRRVQRVLDRLVPACGLPKRTQWEFIVLENNAPNAFVVPGGKICVYSGLFEVIGGDDTALATVLGHEIAHVIARHAAEKMSVGILLLGARVVLEAMLGIDVGNAFPNLLVTLPFSRICESEADYIGLLVMAKAGYDPRRASVVWERFAEAMPRGIALFQTHPNPLDRAHKMREWEAHALEVGAEYRRAQRDRRRLKQFNQAMPPSL